MALAASLLEAAARGHAAQLQRLLAAPSADCNAADENGCSLLQRAAADGHVEVVELLLKRGADPNRQDLVYGNTPAHEAAWKGYSRCVALLAAGRANLHIRNFGGFAPLHLACQNGHNQSCREILLAGAHPDIQNNYGDSSLHTSARYGHAGVMRILISAQCSVSEQNKNGDTALHIAAAMGRRKLTRILLEAGCDKSVRNKQGETARDIATRKDLNEIIQILNTPVAKIKKDKKKDKRDKSRERSIDEPDSKNQDKKKSERDKTPDKKDKKKGKSVHFEAVPEWSPYGCHYYPDPKFFPKPKLDSLPKDPLKKGEQYYLDLAGNIKKGPIGVGYTCYCAPFFKHMEDKLNEDKQDLKKHIDIAHDRLNQKVSNLEEKTQEQITELTRFVVAERSRCKERHTHLEKWLTRGLYLRASERVKKLDLSPSGSLDIPPLKRTKSLDILESKEWSTVNKIIKSFNKNVGNFDTKDLKALKMCSRSSETVLDDPLNPLNKATQRLKGARSSDVLDSRSSGEQRTRSPGSNIRSTTPSSEHYNNAEKVSAEIHINTDNYQVAQSPQTVQNCDSHSRYSSPNRYPATAMSPDRLSPSYRKLMTKSPEVHSDRHYTPNSPERYSNSSRQKSPVRIQSPDNITGRSKTELGFQHSTESNLKNVDFPHNEPLRSNINRPPVWKSQVLQRTADDIRKRTQLDKELPHALQGPSRLEISQDGYVKIPKHDLTTDFPTESQNRKSVQELVAQVEENSRESKSPEPQPLPRHSILLNPNPPQVAKKPSQPPQQPSRPAPVLKDSKKRFSFHNLIPFPTRKSFQTPPKDNGNQSESSDDEDEPIRKPNRPGPMKNTNLAPTNYDTNQNTNNNQAFNYPQPHILVPKDAYFHELPNRRFNHQLPYQETIEASYPNTSHSLEAANETGLPPQSTGRNRTPIYHPTGVFDAMMQDHIVREMERIPHPHCYKHLDQNTEIEIAEGEDVRTRYQNDGNSVIPAYPPQLTNGVLANGIPGIKKPIIPGDHNFLHSRLHSLAINTNLTDVQSQIDRESHNDSGYSTKVYGSSQGPSPSLSGNVECDVNRIGNGKPKHGIFGSSSLV